MGGKWRVDSGGVRTFCEERVESTSGGSMWCWPEPLRELRVYTSPLLREHRVAYDTSCALMKKMEGRGGAASQTKPSRACGPSGTGGVFRASGLCEVREEL